MFFIGIPKGKKSFSKYYLAVSYVSKVLQTVSPLQKTHMVKGVRGNGIFAFGLTGPSMEYSGHVTIMRTGFNGKTYSSSMNKMYFWSVP